MSDMEKFAEELYELHYNSLIKYARRRMSDWALAEDMVQSTMESALDNIKRVSASPSVKGWLMQTLQYKIRRELDKAYRKHEMAIEDEYITDLLGVSTNESQPLTLAGLEELLPASCPPNMRNILYLRYVEQLQHKEIGEKLGITAGAVQQRLLAAQRWLRDYFDRHNMPYGS